VGTNLPEEDVAKREEEERKPKEKPENQENVVVQNATINARKENLENIK
jgi:hypothetical protein